jgi:hypothetical protein
MGQSGIPHTGPTGRSILGLGFRISDPGLIEAQPRHYTRRGRKHRTLDKVNNVIYSLSVPQVGPGVRAGCKLVLTGKEYETENQA